MQNSYNNSSFPQIPTEENSLFIPECINWNIINSVGPTPTNYRERLMTENSNNTNSNVSDVPVAPSFTRKRRQFQFKHIDNINSNYDSDDSDDESSMVNVPKTIKVMDILYNTNFSVQLRSEQNISTISHYLKNIINKTDDRRKDEVYSIKKIVNVLNWMMQDWKIESIVKVIVNITANWTLNESNKDDSRLGRLIRRITVDWDPQYLAHLVSLIFITHPLCNQNNESSKEYKEVFLKVLSKRWKFCRLSQFFICLGNKGAINHKLKMHLLQRAAKFEDNTKKMNFNFANNQRRKPIVMTASQTQPFIHQPQPQFQIISQSQSVDNLFQQNNQNQSPQMYQTVMILSSQNINHGSPSSTPGQSPHTTLYQIQDIQRPIFSQSPFNDSVSIASSSNSPASSTASPPTFYNSSIPVITTNSTNIPMVTIRSMNHVMTMNTQPVPVVMTPPLNNNVNSNSPPVIVSNITVPNTPNSISSDAFIRLPQGTPVYQTISQGTPILASNVITISTPITTTNNMVDPSSDNSVLLSPSCSSTTSRIASPNIDNTNVTSSTSNHSKLKGKETNKEDESLYYPTNPSPTNQPNTNNNTRQSLLFMTPSTILPSSGTTIDVSNSNSQSQAISNTSQTHQINKNNQICSTTTTTSNINTSSVNVSVPIPLSLNVRNINQKITKLSLEAEKNNEMTAKGMTGHSSNQTIEKTAELSSSNIITSSSSSSTSTSSSSKENKKINIHSNKNESSSSETTIIESKVQMEDTNEEITTTLKEGTSSPGLDEKSPEYYEEIFNLDDFNHEEKKAIYDIIDSSKEDLDKIQMEKDEKIRSFIQENSKDFSNLTSSSPKTPPPSLSSSPFFQK